MSPEQTKSFAQFMIALLCAAALLLILLILGGSDVDETGGKAIGTAISFAFLSLTGIAGRILLERRPEINVLGYLTITVSLAAFLTMTAAIWGETVYDGDWKLAGDLLVLALAGGHACLLLAGERPEDSHAVRLLRAGVLAAIATLCVLAVIEISGRREDIGVQPIAVVAVLYVLGSVVLPLLRRISPESGAGRVVTGVPGVATSAPDGPPRVLRLDHMPIAVSDPMRSTAFYRRVMGAEAITMPDGVIAFRIGSQLLEAQVSPTPLPTPKERDGHLCFIWNGPIQGAVEHLARHSVAIVEGPVARIGSQGPGHSVYCRDPDGSLIEMISYE